MRIYELMNIFSSENKSKIIAHFWDCCCDKHDCVSDLEKQLKINQSNLSKHIGKLLSLGVLLYKQEHKQRFYYLNPKFKSEWNDVIKPIVFSRENLGFACKNCKKGT